MSEENGITASLSVSPGESSDRSEILNPLPPFSLTMLNPKPLSKTPLDPTP